MTLRFGVLGAGRIGRVHSKAIAGTAGASLVAIADPVAKAAQDMADAYGCDIRTIDAILNANDIDAASRIIAGTARSMGITTNG